MAVAMESRLDARFRDYAQSSRTALVCFITAGDPDIDTTVAAMHAMVESGADVIELGMPFSDPMADGPAIQKASERALAGGAGLAEVLRAVERFRARDTATPVVLMGYLNPVEAMGAGTFAERAVESGADGAIIVDLPPAQGSAELAAMREAGLAPIFLIAPNSTDSRIATLCAHATGFVYLVSIKGVTGTREAELDTVRAQVAAIRKHTDLPVGIGFGIRDAQSAAAMATVADAVIVGTVLVEQFADNGDHPERIPEAVAAVVRDLRAGIDAQSG